MKLPDKLVEKYAASLKRGSILFWKDYQFSDGTTRDKMVLVLSDCIKGKCFFVVLPTSQVHHYVNGAREMTDTVCFPEGTSTFFDTDTVVDLKNVSLLEVKKLVPHLSSKAAKKIDELDEADWKRIQLAIENAETLSQRVIDAILGNL